MMQTSLRHIVLLAALFLPAAALAQVPGNTPSGNTPPGKAAPAKPANGRGIVAVVNGDVITTGDVNARRRLFAISSGLPMTDDVLDRLTPQVIRQLIDERLRLQEIQRRHILVSDKDIADSLGEIEKRNNMPQGGLRQKLGAQGVNFHTLVDQIRVQLGWSQVLRQQLGDRVRVSDADVAEQQELLKADIGKPEYRVAEIFIAVDEPSHEADAQRFAEVVAGELRRGAPFPVVAAEFSQSQTALQGGELGWVQANQVDPEVAAILNQMPPGAISNPVKVAGGFTIVTLQAKREIGHDEGTLLHVRQAFLPFATPLNPAEPTEAQRAALDRMRQLSANAHDCNTIEEANKSFGSGRPADPGDIRLEQLANPQLRALLTGLSEGKASQPLVGNDGISIVMVCSREQRNFGQASKEDITTRLLDARIELASRQLQRDLRRRSMIEQKTQVAG